MDTFIATFVRRGAGCAAIILLVMSCTGGIDRDEAGGAAFEGLWRYEAGSFSFVNCYMDSRSVDLGGTGFEIVDQNTRLVRVGTDGCRLTLVPAAPTHARGVGGETCTVDVTDPSGNPITTRYQVRTWIVDLKPDDASEIVEVFDVVAETRTSLGTISCEISGNNTLKRVP